jgi:hypothetical protein
MKFGQHVLPSHIVLRSDTYLNHHGMSLVAAPQMSPCTRLMRVSWIYD